MADWFRSWHGAPSDPKLAVIAAKAKVDRAVAIAVWWLLLDHASQAAERGDISGADPEVFAAVLGMDDDAIRAVLSALEAKGLIIGGKIAAWAKRQPEREDSTAAERKRRQREKQRDDSVTERDSDDMSRNVTHASRTRAEAEQTQSRAEQGSARELVETGNACLQAMGTNPAAFTGNFGAVQTWLNAGYSHAEIREAVQAVAARPGFSSPRNPMGWLAKVIPEELERRRAAGSATEAAFKPTGWKDPATAKFWTGMAASGRWTIQMGPKPGYGGCDAPAEAQKAYLAATGAAGCA